MANKKTETLDNGGALATLEPTIVEAPLAPVTQNSQALTTPTDDARDIRGKEDIDSRDVMLPRLALAQAMTPQTKRGNKAQIEGLLEGHIFNTLTEENFQDQVGIIVLKLNKTAHVFDEQGKVIERDVPWDDPRCEFTEGPNGERIQPAADRCYDFLVYTPQAESVKVAILRMKRTQIKVARRLNTLMQLTPGASWNAIYPVTTVVDTAGTNQFYNFKIGMGKKTTPEQRAAAEALFNTFGGKTISVIDVVDTDEGDRGAMAADQGDGI
jgi:hypothetical protein